MRAGATWPSRSIARRTAAIAELLQLGALLDRPSAGLSVNILQRVAIGRSAMMEPAIFLLDEPLSALDVKLKKVLQAELKRLHRSVGVTFVHVTHDLEEAMMLADRICVMRAGKILQLGEPADIYYRPADPFVAGFIGETNLMPITVTGRSGAEVRYSSDEIVDAQGSLPASLVAEDLGQGPALMNVRPELILEFLMFDEDFPRSIRFSTARIEEHLSAASRYVDASHAGPELALDICFACQGLWFDRHENLKLAPAAVVGLFVDNTARPMVTGIALCASMTWILARWSLGQRPGARSPATT